MLTKDVVPVYDHKLYSKIALNDLVTYSVYFLMQVGDPRSSENISAACFLLFPKRFCLRNYPEWPDSTVVNKSRTEFSPLQKTEQFTRLMAVTQSVLFQ